MCSIEFNVYVEEFNRAYKSCIVLKYCTILYTYNINKIQFKLQFRLVR